ncbi:altronate hydrolase [Klebsiella michiganensis]|nr:altronate hydrolase [Klebsiella michiganensis]
MQYIKIHSHDNVAVALADMAAGTVVTIDAIRSRWRRILRAA